MIVGVGPAVLLISSLLRSMLGLGTETARADVCLSALVLQGSSWLRNWYQGEPRPYIRYWPWLSFQDFLFSSVFLCFAQLVIWLVSLSLVVALDTRRRHPAGQKPDNAPAILWGLDPLALEKIATLLGLASYFGQAFFVLLTEPIVTR